MKNYFELSGDDLQLMLEETIINKNQYEILKMILQNFKISTINNMFFINNCVTIIKNKSNISLLINNGTETKTYTVLSKEELIILVYEVNLMQLDKKDSLSTLEIKSNPKKDLDVTYSSLFFKRLYNTRITSIMNQDIIDNPNIILHLLNSLLYNTTVKFLQSKLPDDERRVSLKTKDNGLKPNTI